MNSEPIQTSADGLSAESVSSPLPTPSNSAEALGSSSSPAGASLDQSAPLKDAVTAASVAANSGSIDSADSHLAQATVAAPLRGVMVEGARARGDQDEGPPSRPGREGNRGRDRRPHGARKERGARDSALDDALGAEPRRAKVPLPSRRQPLPADLEQELEAAFAGTSMEALVSGTASAAATGAGIEVDSRLTGVVVKIHGDDVFFALDERNEGVASLQQFRDVPDIGMTLEVVVTRYQPEDGLYELRVPGAAIDVEDWSDLVEGAVVEARVTGSNTGGLECAVGSIRGFIPASQIELFHVENYAEYHDKRLSCVVVEANERRRNLVLSHRALLEREKAEQREKLLTELEVGDVREGVVTSVRDFGAFVDIGGLDGLVHVSQLSWERVAHPSEVLEPGQKIRVRIERIDRQTGKIGLNYRDLLDDPWADVEARFPAESLVSGVVTRIAQFGAFVKLATAVEGLIHISELAHHRVVQVANVVREGDEVLVKVLAVDPESKRISLSLKDAHPLPDAAPQTAQEAEAPAADEPVRKPVVPPSGKPLKGGTGQSSGGDRFGLTW